MMDYTNSARPNNQLIKDFFRKPSILIRGILELLMIGAAVGMLVAMNDVSADLIRIVNEIFGSDIPDNLFARFAAGSFAVPAIVILLTAASWFFIFGKSRSSSDSSRPDAGFVILNVFAIIRLIGAILVSVCGVIFAVFIFIKKPASIKDDPKKALIFLLIMLAVCALILIVALVNKLYIGSIRKTAKSDQLYRTGAKATGVFFVLNAVFEVFYVAFTLLLIFLHGRFYEIIRELFYFDAPEELGNLFADSSTWIFLCLFLSALLTFITHIVDAKIALGYNNHIKNAELYGYGDDQPQPPADDGFYGGDREDRPKKKTGYGDRFIED